mmetsp:Transcript_29709/g.78300  ORF Transcript_29709/g.78300 Transcript_29709/m.78300 type:complete len:99 (-) Transcript_29709:2329-2625(-)
MLEMLNLHTTLVSSGMFCSTRELRCRGTQKVSLDRNLDQGLLNLQLSSQLGFSIRLQMEIAEHSTSIMLGKDSGKQEKPSLDRLVSRIGLSNSNVSCH